MDMQTAFKRATSRNQFIEHAERISDILAQPEYTAADLAQVALRLAMMQTAAIRVLFAGDDAN
jgi:hypothetical protein